MPAITDVEFREFSARHRNASRNWRRIASPCAVRSAPMSTS